MYLFHLPISSIYFIYLSHLSLPHAILPSSLLLYMLSVGGRYLSAVSEVPLSPSTGSGTTAAPPGAYKMPGAPRNQRFYVTIPRGVRPGQHFDMNMNKRLYQSNKL